MLDHNENLKDFTSIAVRPLTMHHGLDPSFVTRSIDPVAREGAEVGIGALTEHYRPVIEEAAETAERIATAYRKKRAKLLSTLEAAATGTSAIDDLKAKLLDEDGINVDSSFNNNRKFGKGIEVFFFRSYLFMVRQAYTILKENMISKARTSRLRAVANITRYVRGFLSRLNTRAIRHNRLMQKQAELKVLLAELKQQHRSASVMRKAWLFHRMRQILRRQRREAMSRLNMQRTARGFLGRRKATQKMRYLRSINAAATLLQCLWRRTSAMRKLRLLQKIEAVHLWEVSNFNRQRIFRTFFKLHGASICISSAYRSYVIRERLHNLLYYNRIAMGIHIQRVYRGHRGRKLVRGMRLELALQTKRERLAAVRIQSIARVSLAKSELKVLRQKREERMEQIRQRKALLLRDRVVLSINISKIRRRLVKAYRSTVPFRFLRETKSATRIQALWRGHHWRVVVLRMRVRRVLTAIWLERRRQVTSATKIQKVFRGHRTRRLRAGSKRHSMAQRLQTWWRRCRAKRFVTAIRTRVAAVNIISKRVRGMLARRRYLHVQKTYLSKQPQARVLQRLARRYLGRRALGARKDRLRVRVEASASAELSTTKALSEVQLMILAESLDRTLGKKYPTRSGEDCPCLGPWQAMFVFALGKKGYTDNASLASNRLDGSSFMRIAMKVDGLFSDGNKNSGSVPSPKAAFGLSSLTGTRRTSLSAISSSAEKDSSAYSKFKFKSLTLLRAIRLKLLTLPKISKRIKKTDFDLAFSKCKTTAGVNVLSYPEFVACLKTIGDIVFGPGIYLASRKARLLAKRLSPDMDDTSSVSSVGSGSIEAGAEEDEEESKPDLKKVPSFMRKKGRSFKTRNAEDRSTKSEKVKPLVQTLLEGTAKTVRDLTFLPRELLTEHAATSGLSFALLLLRALEKDENMREVAKWIEYESRARVGFFVARIQRMVRKRMERGLRSVLQAQRRQQLALRERERRIILCQSLVRMFLARRRTTKLAQTLIKKYVPASGPPYWYNPATSLTTWSKPRILGRFECLSLPVPIPGLQYLIKCCNCDRPGSINCLNCEESMCDVCFSSLHCKGKRTKHERHKILMCSLCTEQMATKSCITCALRKPKKGSPQQVIKRDFSVLCDGCFCHYHDVTEQKPEDNWAKRDAQRALEGSKDAYLVGQSLQQRIRTDHHYDPLVQPCEECVSRAAAWRCADCDQVYCDRCLIGMHSIGGPFSKHKAETLPYYSPEMHKRFETGALTRRLQDRVERVAQAYGRLVLQRKVKCAVKIQSWWRMVLGREVGKEKMKQVRSLARRAHRLRKLETNLYRNTLVYKIKDVFGLAPALRSDTVEEQVLKRISCLGRLRAKEYIWTNKEDWGFYRVSSTDPKKGVPKTGFQVGTVDELKAQAVKGGFRMPGRVHLAQGQYSHPTSMDLSQILYPGHIVRINKFVFKVVSSENMTLTLNRKWRGKEEAEEVLYRLPTHFDEKKMRYFKVRHALFDWAVRNPVSQNSFKLRSLVCRRVAAFSRGMTRQYKKRGFMLTAYRWGEYADKYEERSLLARALLDDEHAGPKLPDLSRIRSTDVGKVKIKSGPPAPEKDLQKRDDLALKRKTFEEGLSVPELLAEAAQWTEMIHPRSNLTYYVHSVTGEQTFQVPLSVETMKYKAKEDERKQKAFADAQEKLVRLQSSKSKGKGRR